MNGPPSAVALPRAAATADMARIAMSSHTRAMLEGRIVPTLLRMAWPNILVMVAQSASGLIETWFVSRLGTDALAGMALVFPGFMLMQMLSAGAVGGGISSAVARALGGQQRILHTTRRSAGNCGEAISAKSRSSNKDSCSASARSSTARPSECAHTCSCACSPTTWSGTCVASSPLCSLTRRTKRVPNNVGLGGGSRAALRAHAG